jgi:hypothetical protein
MVATARKRALLPTLPIRDAQVTAQPRHDHAFAPLGGHAGASSEATEILERGARAAFRWGGLSQQEEAFMILSSTLLRPVLCAGLFLAVAATTASADERCQQLVALNNQYKGVTLTSDQKALKVRLVAWYRANCMNKRSASASRAGAEF